MPNELNMSYYENSYLTWHQFLSCIIRELFNQSKIRRHYLIYIILRSISYFGSNLTEKSINLIVELFAASFPITLKNSQKHKFTLSRLFLQIFLS